VVVVTIAVAGTSGGGFMNECMRAVLVCENSSCPVHLSTHDSSIILSQLRGRARPSCARSINHRGWSSRRSTTYSCSSAGATPCTLVPLALCHTTSSATLKPEVHRLSTKTPTQRIGCLTLWRRLQVNPSATGLLIAGSPRRISRSSTRCVCVAVAICGHRGQHCPTPGAMVGSSAQHLWPWWAAVPNIYGHGGRQCLTSVAVVLITAQQPKPS
jgi:hypothetical protein